MVGHLCLPQIFQHTVVSSETSSKRVDHPSRTRLKLCQGNTVVICENENNK